MTCLFTKRDVEINAAHEPIEKSEGMESCHQCFPQNEIPLFKEG